ncbi:hypothetical protein [Myroides odoratimimus]|uniref:hypothetical protein n=1 Tax=Myroides odoratimimus TaxID=76832 RepID=UPI002DC01EDA|nr:hypothetical protein [Myroides odoratimimus]MEC4086236.1 hypothetical protein [Myroides odoratimimus]
MNKKVKIFLIAINILTIVISAIWYLENLELEPLISIITQISGLLILCFENKLGSIINTKKNENSEIDIDASKGDLININRNKGSKINIKTRD